MISRHGTPEHLPVRPFVALVALAVSVATFLWAGTAFAQASAAWPRVSPITIVINQSPWFGGFSKVVEAYERRPATRSPWTSTRLPAAARSSATRSGRRRGSSTSW